MKSYEFIIENILQSQIDEGVNDPNIFKVVFLIGGPGSGKSTVAKMLALNSFGLVNINSDLALTYLMKKNKLDLQMPPEEKEKRDVVRTRAKEITGSKMNNAIDGRLGLFIDGTGEDYSKIQSLHTNLSELGYESYLVIVYAPLEVAQANNAKRERRVPDDTLLKKWQGAVNNINNFIDLIPNHSFIRNTGSMDDLKQETEPAYKQLMKWIRVPVNNSIANSWIEQQSNVNEALDDKNIEALLKAKAILKQKEQEDLAAWQKDIEQKYPQLTQKPAAPAGWGTEPQQPTEPEVKEPIRVMQAKLAALNTAIEKTQILNNLRDKVNKKGLLTQALASDTDIDLYVKDAYKDGYKSLNDKLDKSIAILKNRLNTNRLAFRESIDVDKAFPIETWYEDDDTYANVAVAHDSEGRDIEVIFTPLHDEVNAIDFDFTRGGTFEKTGEGEAGKVFATVLNAFSSYLSNINTPDYILFASKGGSRTSAYQAMIRRFAGRFGYKPIQYNDLPPEIADQPQAEGHQFVLARV